MKPTDEDVRVLAYFEAEDRKHRGESIPEALARLAAEAPPREAIDKRTLFHGWLVYVDGGRYALTLSGQDRLSERLVRTPS